MINCQNVLDNCSYGLYIVTSNSKGKLNGQISDALMQVTAFAPQTAVCINKNELTHEYIKESGVYAANILKKSSDLQFIGLFGFKSGRDTDKISQVKYKIGETGCPIVLENTVSSFEVKVTKEIDLGTHTMFIGEVVNAEQIKDDEVMTYGYYKTSLKGKTSKNSPSYNENAKEKKMTSEKSGKYICD